MPQEIEVPITQSSEQTDELQFVISDLYESQQMQ
jgi:hypothetical protein